MVKKLPPRVYNTHHFDIKNPKNFWGEAVPVPQYEGTLPDTRRHPTPLGTSILLHSPLDFGAFGASCLSRSIERFWLRHWK